MTAASQWIGWFWTVSSSSLSSAVSFCNVWIGCKVEVSDSSFLLNSDEGWDTNKTKTANETNDTNVYSFKEGSYRWNFILCNTYFVTRVLPNWNYIWQILRNKYTRHDKIAVLVEIEVLEFHSIPIKNRSVQERLNQAFCFELIFKSQVWYRFCHFDSISRIWNISWVFMVSCYGLMHQLIWSTQRWLAGIKE